MLPKIKSLMKMGSKIKFVRHHISALNGRKGIIQGPVLETFYSWRIWVCRNDPVMCGPMTRTGMIETCQACGQSWAADPKMPRTEHHWFDPSDLHSFVIEANETTFEVLS